MGCGKNVLLKKGKRADKIFINKRFDYRNILSAIVDELKIPEIHEIISKL